MAMTDIDYCRALMQLLPQGEAWPQDPDSTLGKLLHALADGFERIDSQLDEIATRETLPRTAQQLLTDWEACLGLPECGDISDTIEKRQMAAEAKFTMSASLNLHFLEELALKHGYVVKIAQEFAHNCMRDCMYPLVPQTVRFTAYVTVYNQIDHYRATCLDNCMTPLIVYETGDLECLFERYGPAYETFIYYYPDSED
ncbi:YmfQ family protein [Rahnella contaminans]|uniref:YmfQ family protein n=1 Tax=Rahnella contaminans TaxID=2703882 RepID=UPI003C2B58B7